MKKIITLITVWALTAYGHAQSSDRFYDSESDYKQQVEARDPGTDGPINGPDEPAAPIDDYLPLLLAAGLGMVAWVAHRQKTKTV